MRMLKSLYGMPVSSILYYKKSEKDIEGIGFEVNPYDICVTNQMKYGKQQTVTFHVNDLKSIHVDTKVNDELIEWCKETYGRDNLGHAKVVRRKIQEYWGMIMNFIQKRDLNNDMKYYTG